MSSFKPSSPLSRAKPTTHSSMSFSPLLPSSELQISPSFGRRSSSAISIPSPLRNVDFGGTSSPSFTPDDDDPFIETIDDDVDTSWNEVVSRSWHGLTAGFNPVLSPKGVGGTYFIKDNRDQVVGVFKPVDEEPLSRNNPKGLSSADSASYEYRHGIGAGEASMREVCAYLLDHEHFAGVPPTHIVRFRGQCFSPSIRPAATTTAAAATSASAPKIGSYQAFVENDWDCEDIGPGVAKLFPVREVHKIGILDIRLFNTDRHGGNVLIKEEDGKPAHLIPIDHGFVLPAALDEAMFEWLHWAAAKEPFDEETLNYIARLSAENDATVIRSKFPELGEGPLRVLKIATMWLKLGAAHGLNLFELGQFITRQMPDEPSQLEDLVGRAERVAALCTSPVEGTLFSFEEDPEHVSEEDSFFVALEKEMLSFLRTEGKKGIRGPSLPRTLFTR